MKKTTKKNKPFMPGTNKHLKPGVVVFGATKWHWINKQGNVCSGNFKPTSNVISEQAYKRMFT